MSFAMRQTLQTELSRLVILRHYQYCHKNVGNVDASCMCYNMTATQWLKCHRTQGNAVPPPPIFSRRRSLASNFQRTQGSA